VSLTSVFMAGMDQLASVTFHKMLGAIFVESDLALTEVLPGPSIGESLERIRALFLLRRS
jgi:hypothetical protein